MKIQSLLKKILSLVCLCYFPAAFSADADTLLNTRLSEIHTLQADFVQKITDARGSELSQSEGSLSLERPGKFRWEVKRPERQLIIAAGKEIKVYDPSLQQMIVRPIPEQDSNLPALLLSRTDMALVKHFDVSQKGNNPEKFRLVPKKKDGLFTAFEIEFRKGSLHQLTFTDHLNQTTAVVFKNEKRNQPLAATLFQLKPPKGTDIIYDKNS